MTTMSTDADMELLAAPGFPADAVRAISERSSEPAWLRDRRVAAHALWQETPMPTTRDEHWRFTSLRGLDLEAAATFTADAQSFETTRVLEACSVAGAAEYSARFVSVNSELRSSELVSAALPDGVVVASLSDAVRDHEELVSTYLGRAVPASASVNDKFVSLNDAAWTCGVFVHVPRSVSVELPIEFITAHATDAATVQPRIIVVLEAGARATFIDESVSVGGASTALSNAVVELLVGRGAHLTYVTTQNLSTSVDHFSTHRVLAEQDAQVDWVAVGLGGGRGKARMEARLLGPGASVKLTGAYALDGRQLIDYDTHQFHEAPNAFSDLSFKGVLDGHARSVWRGMIAVLPGAQGTDSYQENRNLLLAPTAHADSIPGLQIEANEVRCTHGATLSKVDPEQLFYLMARGVHRPEAVRTIVRGFFAPQLDRIADTGLRERVSDSLYARLDAIAR